DRLAQLVAHPLDVLRLGADRWRGVECRVVQVPVTNDLRVVAARDEVMRGRNLVDPLEERAVPVQDGVQILVEALVVPARRDPRREERLRLGGEVERVAPARIVERLDAEAITRREDEAVPLVPEHEGELTAQVAEAVGALLLVEVEKYLAVGARTQAVAAHDELALVASVVVELTVHDDVELLILVGDRLVAGGEVDDAEPRVPH